ncbi:MBL fold metallo-hydrolase [bacterium]|nr:MBL fold metallo-hydrolase [bacterium]
MEAAIIYDNSACKKNIRYGWGFSCLVGRRVLFDTGESSESLFYNMDQLNVDISKIEAVVISHDHWDHTGGLWGLLKKREGLPVYSCPGFGPSFIKRVRQSGGRPFEAERYQRIDDNISVTGEVRGKYRGGVISEQALIVETGGKITVIVGCSHPGIVTIVERVKTIFPGVEISLVFGGFHLKDEDPQSVRAIVSSMKELGVEKVAPAHCTGEEAKRIFREGYGENFVSVQAGEVFEI